MAFFAIKSRIGAVRSLLHTLQGQPVVLASTASAQCASLASLLEGASADLTPEQQCTIQLKLQDLKVSPDMLAKLLCAFGGKTGASDPSAKKRVPRKTESQMQDYANWHNFIMDVEWDKIDELRNVEPKDVYQIAAMIVELVCSRMWCINPSEKTLKFMASSVIAISFDDIEAMARPLHEKIALRDYMRTEIKTYWKGPMAKPLQHCTVLPSSLPLLASEAPLLHANMMSGGCVSFGKSRLSLQLTKRVDSTFKCRSNVAPSTLAVVPSAPTAASAPFEQMLKMQMQMMQMHMAMRMPQDDDCPGESLNIDFNVDSGKGGAKRSLAAVRDAVWKRSRPGSAALPDRPSGPAPAELPSGPAPAQLPSGEAPATLPSGPAPAALTSVPAPAAPAAPATEEATEGSPSPEEESKSLIDALIARDEQTKLEATEKRKEISAKKAAEKAAEKAAAKDAVAVAKLAEKAEKASKASKAASVVAKSSPAPKKVAQASKSKTVTAAAPTLPTLASKPTYSHERTRSQFLCRTGYKGAGQSLAITYLPKGEITEAEAEAKAKKWLTQRIALAGA